MTGDNSVSKPLRNRKTHGSIERGWLVFQT